jgi:hypothetical protein
MTNQHPISAMTPQRATQYAVALPNDMTPEQRRHELARMLARGVLRLRQHHRLIGHAAAPPTTTPESSAGRLEVSGETVLSVHTG